MPDSPLKQRILESMKDAMRARDKARLGVLRLMLAEIKKVEVDERVDPDDGRVTAILDRMVKQRRESIEQFQTAGRDELAAAERDEVAVIREFLPEALGEREVAAAIDEALAESGASGMRDMGRVMGLLKPRLAGRADMGQVSARVRAALQDRGRASGG